MVFRGAVSVVFLTRGACGDGMVHSCLLESAEVPGCTAHGVEGEAVGTGVLLQSGHYLEGTSSYASQKSTDMGASAKELHTSTMELSSVVAGSDYMYMYDIWADPRLTCDDAKKCTCNGDASITLGISNAFCKVECLNNDNCMAAYWTGDPDDVSTWICFQHSTCESTRIPVVWHYSFTYKKMEYYSMCSGSTTQGSTNWVQDGSNGIYVDVDTSFCGFSATPIYATSLGGGSGSWVTRGSSELYAETKSGFRIYMSDITPAEANNKGWHINWIAQRAGRGQGSTSCAGQTTKGSTSWEVYQGNIGSLYVDVDTSSCGFSATPVYITSMGGSSGDHHETTGSSEVYQKTKSGFRIYINHPDGGLTPSLANSRDWHINWVAQEAGTGISWPSQFDGFSCAGESGSADWYSYPYGNGVVVNVDTSSCAFPGTPVYVTSLGGSVHWLSTGSSEVYKETATGFRIYIRLSGITVSKAQAWNWSVHWIGYWS